MSNSKWSWSFGRAFSSALVVGVVALLGVRDAMIQSGNLYLLIIVFGAVGLALWLGGLRRITSEQASQEEDIRKRVEGLGKNTTRGEK